jgi:hypothetical protein
MISEAFTSKPLYLYPNLDVYLGHEAYQHQHVLDIKKRVYPTPVMPSSTSIPSKKSFPYSHGRLFSVSSKSRNTGIILLSPSYGANAFSVKRMYHSIHPSSKHTVDLFATCSLIVLHLVTIPIKKSSNLASTMGFLAPRC